jgi:hypothetical protein
MPFDKEKFKTLVLYIIWRAGHRDGFGATKLNKVLWFSDARSYMLHGKPITGATYIREKRGPVPKQVMPIRAELEREGLLEIKDEPYYNRQITRFRFMGNVPPDISRFTSEELQIIDWWIKHIDEDHTANSISEQSHDYAWEIAEMGEELPLYAVFAGRIRAPRGKELEWARAEAERLGLV